MNEKGLDVQHKQELESGAESVKGGPLFVPRADIFEDKEALTLLLDMPGVQSEGVSINLENNQLTVYGKLSPMEDPGTPVYSEYRQGDFTRSFALSSGIDQSKIDASMKNGVLRLRLPKTEALKPRKIEVKTD